MTRIEKGTRTEKEICAWKEIWVRKGMAVLGLGLALSMSAASAFPAQAAGTATYVDYNNLPELLQEGNQGLKQANENYETNKKNYEEMLAALREERDNMRFLAKKYEDDPEAKATYSASASALAASASRISDRLESLNRRTQLITLEHNVDSYTMAAQSLMISYNQMVPSLAASEKSVEAMEASYNSVVHRQAAGSATAADVAEAADRLAQERNLCDSYRQQVAQLRFRLLSVLGLPDDGTVTIGPIPEPDLAAIDGVDYEADRVTAVNSNDSVQSVRHGNARTATDRNQKAANETAAVGDAEAEFSDVYQRLLSARAQYQAALDAFSSAEIAHRSLQLKQGAGMLNQTQLLQGEADYLDAVAQKETASMDLVQAFEDYRWQVKGITEARL